MCFFLLAVDHEISPICDISHIILLFHTLNFGISFGQKHYCTLQYPNGATQT